MTKFSSISAHAISLPDDDVDTDIIYPARFLLITEREGLARYAFADRVSNGDKRIGADHSAPILIAGRNFGCGSSREHAVWALAALGVKVILAPSFGEIFRTNCANNGILAGIVAESRIAMLHIAADAGEQLLVDLTSQTVSCKGEAVPFMIGEAERESLLNGWNETTRILSLYAQNIAHFEQNQRAESPWLWASEAQKEYN